MQRLIEKWRIYIASKGDEDAKLIIMQYIWQEYHQRLMWYIRKTGIKNSDCEDIMQEVMIKVFDALDKYNPKYSFNTWIYTIAKNHCLNIHKKRKLETIDVDTEAISKPIDQPDTKLLNKELFAEIDKYFESLNEQDGQIAFFCFYEAMKYKEISQLLDVPIGTIKFTVHKIRKELKNQLGDLL